jgi:HSP20 family protein
MAKNENKLEAKSTRTPVERIPVRRSSFLSPFEDILEPTGIFDDFLRPSRLFEDFFRRGLPAWREERFLSPSVDVEETENEYLICAELPGFERNDIKVECTDNQVNISAERSEDETKRRSSRRYYGSFYRSVTLPQGIDSEQIKANYENGVLTIHIPRGDEARPRRIEIGTGAAEKQVKGKNAAEEPEATPTH